MPTDCQADWLKNANAKADTRYGNQDCAAYPDFRAFLTRKDVDAVSIATGNRWHGLGSIYAARAWPACNLRRTCATKAASPTKADENRTITAPLGKSVAAEMRNPPKPLTAPNTIANTIARPHPRTN